MISIFDWSPSPVEVNRGNYRFVPPRNIRKTSFIKPSNISLPSKTSTMGLNIDKMRKNKNVGDFGKRWSGTSSMLMNRNPGPGTKLVNVHFRRR